MAEKDTVEVNGQMMTRAEWRALMEYCPHEHWNHPGVKLMDGTEMSICQRCLYIQPTAIAKIIEEQEAP